jgi:hypothetical protein
MTPPMAAEEKPKRTIPVVFADPCKECGSKNTRVYSRGKYGANGRQRYCHCKKCWATWTQTPKG